MQSFDGGTVHRSHFAAKRGHADLYRQLVSRGADSSILDTNGCSAEELARDKGIV